MRRVHLAQQGMACLAADGGMIDKAVSVIV
jgi:hypothetical protein